MKKALPVILMALIAVTGFSQDAKKEDKSKRPSPPGVAEGTIDGVKIKIDYSKPSAKGRKMLGGIEPFGTVWRTGANETTTIELSGTVKIEGKELAAGKYGLFTIPGESEWVIIFNKGIKWGAYSYKQEEDVLRVTVKPSKTDSFAETFDISVGKDNVTMKWENTLVAFKVSK